MFLPKFWACPTCGSILGFYFLPWLFPSFEKVGSTLYEMVSQNAEKFHLEDRKHGFLSCTLRVIGAPNPTIFPYEGLVKPPITLLKCAAKFFVFSQLSCSERILEIEVAWFKEKWTKMSLGRLGMVQWFLSLHLQAWMHWKFGSPSCDISLELFFQSVNLVKLARDQKTQFW